MENCRKNTLRLGKKGEDAAVRYLERKKYKVVIRGFRMFRGEIDIISYDTSGTLVFTEVKTRTIRNFGLPEESVTSAKQEQVRKIAQGYLVRNRLGDIPCRFDVISVLIEDERSPVVTHIEDAF